MGGTNSLWVSAGPPRLRPHSAWCLARLPCGPSSPSPPVILRWVTRNEKQALKVKPDCCLSWCCIAICFVNKLLARLQLPAARPRLMGL